MRLIRLFLLAFALLFISPAYAYNVYVGSGTGALQPINNKEFTTPEGLCRAAMPYLTQAIRYKDCQVVGSSVAFYYYISDTGNSFLSSMVGVVVVKEDKCPDKGYPVVTWFDSGTAVPTTVCELQPSGKFCKFVADPNPIIINFPSGRSNIITKSESATQLTSCTPLFDNACDPKDPYGSCYTPPNDGCTRQKNGSIVCPDPNPVDPPDVQDSCNMAPSKNYCVMPSTGCPTGTVYGKYNNVDVCVRSSPPPDTPDPDPNDPDPNDPNDPNNNDIDLSGVIDVLNKINSGVAAVDKSAKAIAAAISTMQDALNSSINGVRGAVGQVKDSVDTVNASVNAVDTSVNANGTKVAEAVDRNGDKIVQAVDRTTAAVEEQTGQDKQFYDWMKGDGKTPEQIAGSVETPFIDLGGMVPSLNGNLIHYAAQCPGDKTLNMPGFGRSFSYTFTFSRWCEGLIMLGTLFQVLAYLHAAYIVIGATRS